MRDDAPLPVNLPMEEALVDLNSQLGDQLQQEQVLSMAQRELSLLVDTESHHHLLQSTTSTRELARLRCLERDGAGDWLGAIPCKSLGLHLRRSEFVVAGRYSLGMKVFGRVGECPAPSAGPSAMIWGTMASLAALAGSVLPGTTTSGMPCSRPRCRRDWAPSESQKASLRGLRTSQRTSCCAPGLTAGTPV